MLSRVHGSIERSYLGRHSSTYILTYSGRCAAWIAWGEAAPFQLEKHAQTAHIAHRDNGRLAVLSVDVADALLERLRGGQG